MSLYLTVANFHGAAEIIGRREFFRQCQCKYFSGNAKVHIFQAMQNVIMKMPFHLTHGSWRPIQFHKKNQRLRFSHLFLCCDLCISSHRFHFPQNPPTNRTNIYSWRWRCGQDLQSWTEAIMLISLTQFYRCIFDFFWEKFSHFPVFFGRRPFRN